MATAFPQDSLLSISERPEFVKPLPEKYKCPVCGQVLLKPQQTECGHHVCESCLTLLFENATIAGSDNVRCPVSSDECEDLRNDGQSVVPDHRFRKEIMQLDVFCLNKENGCEYSGKWNTLQTHLTDCKFHMQDCQYAKEGCREKLLLKDFKKHMESECKYIPEECSYCKLMIPQIKMEDHHNKQCENYESDCPYGCGEKVERKKLPNHKRVCEKKPAKCPFAKYGCQYEGNRDQLQEHEIAEVTYHLRICVSGLASNARVSERPVMPSNMQEIMLQVNRQQAEQEKKLASLINTLLRHGHLIQNLDILQKRTYNEVLTVTNAEKTLSQRIAHMENDREGLTDDRVRGIEEKMGLMEVNVADLEQRIIMLEDSFYDGILIWKINDYYKAKEDAVSGSVTNLTSQPFYSSRRGYKMCCRVYFNGDGQGHTTHISLFFVVMKGKYDAILRWPFQQRVTLQLLDQTSRSHLEDSFKPDLSSSSFQRPVNRDMNVASGCPLFAAHSTIEKSNAGFIGKDKTVFIRVIVQPTKDKDDSNSN